MAAKCVHKGCGKVFTDPAEDCVYHPGPPIFHEGQKGWKCCKPRVLTFDEFLTIPPCTTGKHSTVDDTPKEEPKKADVSKIATLAEKLDEKALPTTTPINPAAAIPPPSAPAPPPEPDSDDPSLAIPANATCRRKGCNANFNPNISRDNEICLHHPGHPIFHEGSKGWSCCKRRVLEFDEFMKIAGCTEKKRHLFVGKGKAAGEEKVNDVRNDFYQTATTVNVSLYLKKIDKEKAKVTFDTNSIDFDLLTTDNKRFTKTYNLFAPIDPNASQYTVFGTKLELKLVKGDGQSWPVLRSDDQWTGERIQIGQAGRFA
ncbi:CORD and CS domain protein [Talaromyces proteolyticus]|uniref:CORD and CS domain protein n=1 Tax=Talaromyces proteolyticus TaxID=1131652 RepID=A0AAD4KR02_9EURO|nr:CORD and CS domain protein [Talaromyces proteolyticus]KAH8697384.1 CORD and CS domain protein [Talaromyces proteolyticus]